jgi:hypothetical protein
VGLLISLALVQRATPVVALLMSDRLLRGVPHYSGRYRLPFLLWVLSQPAM